MEIVFGEKDGVCDCALSGELDMYEAPGFLERCEGKFQTGWKGVLLINLSDLAYVDSSGLGTLFRVYCHVRERNIGFCMYGARGMVSSLLRLSRMSSILPLEADYDLALKRARGN